MLILKYHIGTLILVIIFSLIVSIWNANPKNNNKSFPIHIPIIAGILIFGVIEIIVWTIYYFFII